MDSLAKRIKHVRTKADLNRSEFARTLGVSAAHISAIEKGASASDQFLKAVAIRYKVSEAWLINGTKGGTVEQQQDEYAPHGDWKPSLTTEEFVGIPRGLGMGRAMDLLGVIYASRDETLIRAIYSNLHAFAQVVAEREKRNQLESTLETLRSETDSLRKEVAELKSVLQAQARAATYIGPERRSGIERRRQPTDKLDGVDRRSGVDRRKTSVSNNGDHQ